AGMNRLVRLLVRGDGRWPGLLVALAPLVVTVLLYGRGLDQFFYNDDFTLLRRARDGGLVELVTTQAVEHFEGEGERPLWRPGWWVVVELLHRCFGLDPRGYHLVAIAAHALLVLAVQIAVTRWTASALSGFVAGLLLAATTGPIEAVIWMSAATNVLPAVFLVAASGVAWLVHLESGNRRASLAALALFAASLVFREAAYHLPPLFLVGWLLLRGVPRGREDWMRLGIPVL